MQKIIMVIRGILKPNKSIVIYDEPLTSLDQETRKKIVKLIVNETKGKTIIVITHDPDILPYADHIVRL
jgi:ABC-type lipoprotein export system ATPase subunit